MDFSPALALYPYQKRWINDRARFKEGRWARQTGKSFASACAVVLDCREAGRNKWVCISSGERQVKEFMEKVKLHAEITEKALGWHEDAFAYMHPDGYRDEYKVLECTLRNGSRIIGVPANPDTARGYSAHVYLDEFSVHNNSREIWAAVFPIVSRGFRLMVTYTPKGRQNMAYDISRNVLFSHHVVDIHEAVKEGCPHDIAALKAGIDPDLWAQEYEVQFLDEATAFITYDMLNEVEAGSAGRPDGYSGGVCYVGMDIGRRRDLTVIIALELVGDVLWVRELVELSRASFAAQDFALERIVSRYHPVRVCMDQTGMGEKPVEDAKRKFGEYSVEGVVFGPKTKLDMANCLKRRFEDRQIRIPVSRDLREDIHGVKKLTTSAGNVRFDAESTDKGHSDRFWALALAVHAASNSAWAAEFEAAGPRDFKKMEGYLG